MFPTRYFANSQYAPRYFPKVGGVKVAIAGKAGGGFMKNIGKGMNR